MVVVVVVLALQNPAITLPGEGDHDLATDSANCEWIEAEMLSQVSPCIRK